MATSKVIYGSELRTTSIHIKSGEQAISDAPTDNMGKGLTFSPTDYCATSLAMCMLTIAGIHCQKTDYLIDNSIANVQKVMGSGPRRITEINIEITFQCSKVLDRSEKELLENAARNCPVAKSLHPEIIQDILFEYK